MLKYRDEWAFVSPYDGLGGPPILLQTVTLLIIFSSNYQIFSVALRTGADTYIS
jgi:hypothetical protein